MKLFSFSDPRAALYGLSQEILRYGHKVAPRGQTTREIRHATVRISRPDTCLPTGMGRKFNPRLAAAETLQLLAGVADPDWMTRVSPRYLEFTGGAMTGAYGPRVAPQMQSIIDVITRDPDTRQAVVTIWRPEDDLFRDHGDRPCTVYISFMVRSSRLITSTYMRSQDCYLGLTYDLVMFSQLHHTIANVLDIRAGELVHTVQSLHLYERDFEKAEALTPSPKYPPPDEALCGIGHGCTTWLEVMADAHAIAYDRDDLIESRRVPATPTERWLRVNSEDARRG